MKNTNQLSIGSEPFGTVLNSIFFGEEYFGTVRNRSELYIKTSCRSSSKPFGTVLNYI